MSKISPATIMHMFKSCIVVLTPEMYVYQVHYDIHKYLKKFDWKLGELVWVYLSPDVNSKITFKVTSMIKYDSLEETNG